MMQSPSPPLKTTSRRLSELTSQVNALVGLATTSPKKYDDFKAWLEERYEVRPAVCYLSDHSKQWIARVGQAVMGCPSLLVLLLHGPLESEVERKLEKLHAYVGGLQATLLFSGQEGEWRLEAAVGTPGTELFDELGDLLPSDAIKGLLSRNEATGENLPAPRPRAKRPDGTFFELEPEGQAQLAWSILIGQGAVKVEEAIRLVAEELREHGVLQYERLRMDGLVYSEIKSALAYATRRGLGFDRPKRLHVRATKSDPDEFTRAEWRACVVKAADSDEWIERDILVRSAAQIAVDVLGLGMVRLRSGGRVDTSIRSTINGLLRMGVLEKDGPERLRVKAEEPANLAPKEESNAAVGEEQSVVRHPVPSESRLAKEEPAQPHLVRPSATDLRKHVGHIPHESETSFTNLLSQELKTVEELQAIVRRHVQDFEEAFEEKEFLDIGGAHALAEEAEELLSGWNELSQEERYLVQGAVLYFGQSDEADDDFAIDGLRTDKAVMAAVVDVVRG